MTDKMRATSVVCCYIVNHKHKNYKANKTYYRDVRAGVGLQSGLSLLPGTELLSRLGNLRAYCWQAHNSIRSLYGDDDGKGV